MSSKPVIVYEESWMPPWAPLAVVIPIFFRYRVIVTNESLTFGYLTGLASKTIPISDVQFLSTGSSTFTSDLTEHGGWGIRHPLGPVIVYNAKSGPWVEIRQISTNQQYRFVTNNSLETVSAIKRAQGVPMNPPVADAVVDNTPLDKKVQEASPVE
jgi:hypothetical protein